MEPVESLCTVSYSPSIVTMAVYCIISEIKLDYYWSKIEIFSYPFAFHAPVRGCPSEYYHNVWCGKSRMMGLPDCEKNEDTFSGVYIIPACDGQTDGQTNGQTSCDGTVRDMHTR